MDDRETKHAKREAFLRQVEQDGTIDDITKMRDAYADKTGKTPIVVVADTTEELGARLVEELQRIQGTSYPDAIAIAALSEETFLRWVRANVPAPEAVDQLAEKVSMHVSIAATAPNRVAVALIAGGAIQLRQVNRGADRKALA
jgi:hypothetical protein